jgi:hypothetical protein
MDEEKKGIIASLINLVENLTSTIDKLGLVISGEITDNETSQKIIDEAIDKLDKKE